MRGAIGRGWRFDRGPLPITSFAQFLYVEAAQLLLVPTSAALPFAVRQVDPVVRETRSDALIVSSADADKLRGAIVFLGERQHLWPEWRVIAEREGGNRLSAIIANLALADARKRYGTGNYMFELCTGAKIENVGTSSIRLVMTLATRTLPIIEHAFADEATRTAFMEGQLFGDRFEGAVELAELALLRGRAALANRLDSIAAARAATHSRSVH